MNKPCSRRDFLKRSSHLTLNAAAALSIGLPGLLQSRSTIAASNDYKALVYIFLAGGNDSFNMLAPKGDGALRTRYESGRRNAALSANDLINITPSVEPQIFGGERYNAFGLHPACSDMAALFNNRELGIICNVGNMVTPTSRQQYLDKSVALPPQLFSHADQQRQYQSEPSNQFRFGWGGRIAELLQPQNIDLSVSPLISVSGLNPFQVSQDPDINTFVMSDRGPINLNGFNGDRRMMVEDYMDANYAHLMSKKYQGTFHSGQNASDVISQAFTIAEANDTNYDDIFDATGAGSTHVGRQLKTIAKMIAGREQSLNDRPIYFVKMGGFDTHQNILNDHQQLMQDLNAALKSFRDALVDQNDFDRVLSFAGSEFGRTFTPNGDDAGAGTDHGWGGHSLVMGGMINGGQLFGSHPDLRMGQGLDADTNNPRGRWIPTTSTSQCSATIARWFGVPENNLNSIFPSLDNFPDPFGTAANLDFISTGDLS